MSDQHVIAAQVRDRAGKGAARAARRAGMVPAVIYGAKKDPTHVVIERRQLQVEIAKGGFTSRLLDISVGEGKEHVLPPRDPLPCRYRRALARRFPAGYRLNAD